MLSLKSVTGAHTFYARKHRADAEPFEVSLQNLNADFFINGKVGAAAEVETSFASPRDDVWYLKVRGAAGDRFGGTRKPPQVSREGFVIKTCDQGYVTPEMKCLQPTGEPEPRSRHLPIRKWNIDLAQLRRIVRSLKNHLPASVAVFVTTAGRLKDAEADESSPADANPIALRVKHLPDDYAIISVAGRVGDGERVEYLVVGAEKGEVIANGAYELRDESLFKPSAAPETRPQTAPPRRP